jgi:hypothetical protein
MYKRVEIYGSSPILSVPVFSKCSRSGFSSLVQFSIANTKLLLQSNVAATAAPRCKNMFMCTFVNVHFIEICFECKFYFLVKYVLYVTLQIFVSDYFIKIQLDLN